MDFEILSEITEIETIAEGRGIRELPQLRKRYGPGNWKKGIATIKLLNGEIRRAELHWYEAHGIGKKTVKWKRYVD
jgi:hypothetical protein